MGSRRPIPTPAAKKARPVPEAAERVLERTLRPLPKLLALADRAWKCDMEHVHRLRVATRRADAALAAFRPLAKPRPWKKVRRRVQKLRNAAREARSCDVHLLMLKKRRGEAPDDAGKDITAAIDLVRKDRKVAQREIARAARRVPRKKLIRSTNRLFAALSSRHVPSLRSLARLRLTRRLSVVRAAASADLKVLENIHRLRLATKRLRYSFEIFAPCFDDEFRQEVGTKLKKIQWPLGAINDATELSERLQAYAARDAPKHTDGLTDHERAERKTALERLAGEYTAQRESLREQFLVQWGGFLAIETLDRLQAEIERADS